MSRAESKIQKDILDFLDGLGWWTVKVISSNKRGTHDIIACEVRTGLFHSFEVKDPENPEKGSDLQIYQMRKIHETGGRAYIVESLKDVKMILGLT